MTAAVGPPKCEYQHRVICGGDDVEEGEGEGREDLRLVGLRGLGSATIS